MFGSSDVGVSTVLKSNVQQYHWKRVDRLRTGGGDEYFSNRSVFVWLFGDLSEILRAVNKAAVICVCHVGRS